MFMNVLIAGAKANPVVSAVTGASAAVGIGGIIIAAHAIRKRKSAEELQTATSVANVDLSKTVDDYTQKIRAMDKEIETLEYMVERMEAVQAEMTEDKSMMTKLYNDLRRDNANLRDQNVETTTMLNHLLDVSDAQRVEVIEKNVAMVEQIGELQLEVAKLRDQLMKANKELNEVSTKYRGIIEEFNEHKMSESASGADYLALLDENGDLRKRLAERQHVEKTLRTQIEMLGERVDELKKELKLASSTKKSGKKK